MYIATFGRSVVVLRTINTNPAGANMDVGCRSNAYRDVCFASAANTVKHIYIVLRTTCFEQRS